MTNEEYIKLGDLKVYRLALGLCEYGWSLYENLDWQVKKIIGDQFIRAVDSSAANIAEGYGRFHYLDRIKFYYNARASALETKHWIFLMKRRKIISDEQFEKFIGMVNYFHLQLNIYIRSCYPRKSKSETPNISIS